MGKSTIDDFELGNLMFGNSRGVLHFYLIVRFATMLGVIC